jgi:hypothetical protein
MAIAKKKLPTHAFYGLSSDTKPTGAIAPGTKFYETDTGKEYEWNGAAWVLATDGVTLNTRIAGERNPESSTNGYIHTREESIVALPANQGTEQTICASPCHLCEIWIHTALTNTLTLKDGTTTILVLPTGTIGQFRLSNWRFEADLRLTLGAQADYNKLVLSYKPI